MIPKEISGHSFKGLVNYLKMGKKGAVNVDLEKRKLLFTTNMKEFAPKSWREIYKIMAHYSSENVRRGLMEVANVRGNSREINKDKPPVRHIIFAFPSGASTDKAFIKETVREALSSLESVQDRTLAHHQYAVFLHQDTDHWHVHVVVNMIDHRTGRLADPYRSQQKLQKWAFEWCRKHGFDVCKDRQEKYERIEEQAKNANNDNRPYKDYAGYKSLRGEPYQVRMHRMQLGIERPDHAIHTSIRHDVIHLKKWCQQRYELRQKEWGDLVAKDKSRRQKIITHYDEKIKQAIKLEDNPALFSLHWWLKRERKGFFQRERTLTGRLINALLYAPHLSKGNYVANVFHCLLNPQSRRLALFRAQYDARAKALRVIRIKAAKRAALNKHYKETQGQKIALRLVHYKLREDERWEWRMLNNKRIRGSVSNANSKENYAASKARHAAIPKKTLKHLLNINSKKILISHDF